MSAFSDADWTPDLVARVEAMGAEVFAEVLVAMSPYAFIGFMKAYNGLHDVEALHRSANPPRPDIARAYEEAMRPEANLRRMGWAVDVESARSRLTGEQPIEFLYRDLSRTLRSSGRVAEAQAVMDRYEQDLAQVTGEQRYAYPWVLVEDALERGDYPRAVQLLGQAVDDQVQYVTLHGKGFTDAPYGQMILALHAQGLFASAISMLDQCRIDRARLDDGAPRLLDVSFFNDHIRAFGSAGDMSLAHATLERFRADWHEWTLTGDSPVPHEPFGYLIDAYVSRGQLGRAHTVLMEYRSDVTRHSRLTGSVFSSVPYCRLISAYGQAGDLATARVVRSHFDEDSQGQESHKVAVERFGVLVSLACEILGQDDHGDALPLLVEAFGSVAQASRDIVGRFRLPSLYFELVRAYERRGDLSGASEVIKIFEECIGGADQFPTNMARRREIVLEKKVALESSEKI